MSDKSKKNIIIMSIIVSLSVLIACATIKRSDYSFEECYMAMQCLNTNKKTNDKSICVRFIDACVARLDEEAYKKKIDFCKKLTDSCKGSDCITFRECIK